MHLSGLHASGWGSLPTRPLLVDACIPGYEVRECKRTPRRSERERRSNSRRGESYYARYQCMHGKRVRGVFSNTGRTRTRGPHFLRRVSTLQFCRTHGAWPPRLRCPRDQRLEHKSASGRCVSMSHLRIVLCIHRMTTVGRQRQGPPELCRCRGHGHAKHGCTELADA